MDKYDVLLERLGITPGPYEAAEENNKGSVFITYQVDDDGGVDFAILAECCKGHVNMFSAASQMLKALIEYCDHLDQIEPHKITRHEAGNYSIFLPIIQSATGNHWEKLSAMLREIEEEIDG